MYVRQQRYQPTRLTPSLRRPSAPRAAIAPHPDASAPRRSQWSVQLSCTWTIPENGGQDLGPLPEAPKTCVMIRDRCVRTAGLCFKRRQPHISARVHYACVPDQPTSFIRGLRSEGSTQLSHLSRCATSSDDDLDPVNPSYSLPHLLIDVDTGQVLTGDREGRHRGSW